MFIKQLSVFVENKPGRLHAIMDALSENDINIRALSIADSTDFGVLRIIADKIDLAKKVLKEIGVISKITEVIAVYIDDKVGGLSTLLDYLSDAGIGIDYMYAFLGRTEGKALMVLKADDSEKAISVLEQNKISLASNETI